MIDLVPLDMAVCQKQVDTWYKPRDMAQHFFNWQIDRAGHRYFPDGDTFGNHVRVYVGRLSPNTPPLGFEWTYPSARFFVWEEWMHAAPYAKVCRYNAAPPPPAYKVFGECLHHDGTAYDVGQLIDIGLLIKLFDFGKDLMVCSVGATHVAQKITGDLEMFPGVPERRTPPCAFLNSSKWDVIGG